MINNSANGPPQSQKVAKYLHTRLDNPFARLQHLKNPKKLHTILPYTSRPLIQVNCGLLSISFYDFDLRQSQRKLLKDCTPSPLPTVSEILRRGAVEVARSQQHASNRRKQPSDGHFALDATRIGGSVHLSDFGPSHQYYGVVQGCAHMAIAEYNKRLKKKVAHTLVNGVIYEITFQAESHEALATFEARVHLSRGGTRVISVWRKAQQDVVMGHEADIKTDQEAPAHVSLTISRRGAIIRGKQKELSPQDAAASWPGCRELQRLSEKIIVLLLSVDAVEGVDLMVRFAKKSMVDELKAMLDVVDPQPVGRSVSTRRTFDMPDAKGTCHNV
ncbi:hypothetical protein Leryth_026798 [Lithospermum erythrorhizon]|nr:hypothetical protein Leryth_026798 [Lithospermum erythrorhizon]